MAPRSSIQDTIEYNRKINLIRRMFKSKKYSQSLLPSKSTRSPQSGSSTKVSVKPIDPPCNLSSSKGQDRPRVTKGSQDKCDSVLYTSLAEKRENFKTLLLFIQPSSAPQRDLLPKKEQPCNPDLSDLPSARYTLPPEYVDDLLNDLTINRSQGDSLLQEHQCNFNLDLSDLPPTRYSLPSNFVDEFLDDLKEMDVANQ